MRASLQNYCSTFVARHIVPEWGLVPLVFGALQGNINVAPR